MIGPAELASLQEVLRQASTGLRELFWQNATREMLTALSAVQAQSPEMMDGRVGVITRDGTRIAIAEVYPQFACGVPGSALTQALSTAVECTVFRITTPQGEVFTLPVSEIRGMHTLSGELLKQLEQESMRESGSPMGEPFGFAAYTAAARANGQPAKKRRSARRLRRSAAAPETPTE
jgi:hypothetical protein